MNKKLALLNAILIPLALVTGWTLSKATLVGKAGIFFLHREYTFLNSWWKGTLFVLTIWAFFELIQYFIWKKYNSGRSRLIQLLFVALAIVGLYFTYLDFSTFSHGLLGKRFHAGGYLFWIGWCVISIFFLSCRKTDQALPENRDQQA